VAYIAQVQRRNARVVVQDDRGIPATTLALPGEPAAPQDTDGELAAAGWTRTADWTETAEGWQAPVLGADES
jgi:hypothetical protein